MSPKLKRMSGDEVIKIFLKLGFEIASSRGSHVKVVRVMIDGERQILTIPAHKQLDTGTLQAVVRQAGRYVDRHILQEQFYTR